MKRFSLLILLVLIVSGCAKGGFLKSSYDSVKLGQPYSSAAVQYTIALDNATGKLSMNLEDITPFYQALYINVMIATNNVENKIISRRVELFGLGDTRSFMLPFTEKSLPLTIYYDEMIRYIEDDFFYPLGDVNMNWAYMVVE